MTRHVLLSVAILGLVLVACRRPVPTTLTPALPTKPAATQPTQPTPRPQPTQPSSGIPRPDLRAGALNRLRDIGLAYQQAAILGPVNGPEDLGRDIKIISPRDNQPFVIVWKIDPNRLDKSMGAPLIAWEATADPKGGRCVLRSDFGAEYLSGPDFDRAPKAK